MGLRIVDKIPQMKMGNILSLWENAIAMLADSQKRQMHTQAKQVIAAINDEWVRRTKSPLKIDDFFAWPSSEASKGDGSLSTAGWLDEGMLRHMGYRVGITEGKPAILRQKILDAVFSGPLPPVLPSTALEEWSDPSSALRLRKMAETIVALSRNAKRRRDSKMSVAIDSWDRDLDYLYHEYYVGHFHFAWPSAQL